VTLGAVPNDRLNRLRRTITDRPTRADRGRDISHRSSDCVAAFIPTNPYKLAQPRGSRTTRLRNRASPTSWGNQPDRETRAPRSTREPTRSSGWSSPRSCLDRVSGSAGPSPPVAKFGPSSRIRHQRWSGWRPARLTWCVRSQGGERPDHRPRM